MPRRRTHRIKQIKAELSARARSEFLAPGDRFPSARALSQRFAISYQTAHRLIEELCGEGLLVRRRGSGTYAAGARARAISALLVFHPRARRRDSFGAYLLELLQEALKRNEIPTEVRFAEVADGLSEDVYPVLWEAQPALAESGRYWLLLNNRPAPGLAASFCDSVVVDDFSGGVAAGEVLRGRFGVRSAAVLSGPAKDRRSRERVEGFRRIFPEAPVISAGGWELRAKSSAPERLHRLATEGVFCALDRLAEGYLGYIAERGLPSPPMVGFDDAPIAASCGLTTIAIPWKEIVETATETVRRRLRGDTSAGRLILLAPRPVVRSQDSR